MFRFGNSRRIPSPLRSEWLAAVTRICIRQQSPRSDGSTLTPAPPSDDYPQPLSIRHRRTGVRAVGAEHTRRVHRARASEKRVGKRSASPRRRPVAKPPAGGLEPVLLPLASAQIALPGAATPSQLPRPKPSRTATWPRQAGQTSCRADHRMTTVDARMPSRNAPRLTFGANRLSRSAQAPLAYECRRAAATAAASATPHPAFRIGAMPSAGGNT